MARRNHTAPPSGRIGFGGPERTVLGPLNLNASCGDGQMRAGAHGNPVGQGGLLAARNVGGLLGQVQDGARGFSATGLSGPSLARRNREFQEPCLAVIRSAAFTEDKL